MITGVDEKTLQFVIRAFAITVGIIIVTIVVTLAIIVIKDGSNPVVQNAFNSLITLATWAMGILGAVIVGKPVATAITTYLSVKGSAAMVAASPQQGTTVTVAPGVTTVQPTVPNGTPVVPVASGTVELPTNKTAL